jgi:hypothetical protein
MPYDLHVIHCDDFISLGAQGGLDLDASRQALAGLAAAMVRRGAGRAIVDVRGVQQKLTTTAILQLARTFHEAGFRHEHRLAILHRWERVAESNLFAASMFRRGWNVRSFDLFEDAFEWLTTDRAVRAPPDPFLGERLPPPPLPPAAGESASPPTPASG